MSSVSVVIPSLISKPFNDVYCVENAVKSVLAQEGDATIHVYVGVDHEGKKNLPKLATDVLARAIFINTEEHGAENVINSTVKEVHTEFVAFCMDADTWEPKFLKTALPLLEEADFVASNTLQIKPDGSVVKISDFPKMSGWIMRRKLWDAVGGMNADCFASDNEWLGRLGSVAKKRIMLVEATAPVDEWTQQVRPWLNLARQLGVPTPRVVRHDGLKPLVNDMLFNSTKMGATSSDPQALADYRQSVELLTKRFGHFPW